MSGNEVSTLIFVHIEDIKVDTNTDIMSVNMSVSLFHLLLLQNQLYQPEITQKAAKSSKKQRKRRFQQLKRANNKVFEHEKEIKVEEKTDNMIENMTTLLVQLL